MRSKNEIWKSHAFNVWCSCTRTWTLIFFFFYFIMSKALSVLRDIFIDLRLISHFCFLAFRMPVQFSSEVTGFDVLSITHSFLTEPGETTDRTLSSTLMIHDPKHCKESPLNVPEWDAPNLEQSHFQINQIITPSLKRLSTRFWTVVDGRIFGTCWNV